MFSSGHIFPTKNSSISPITSSFHPSDFSIYAFLQLDAFGKEHLTTCITYSSSTLCLTKQHFYIPMMLSNSTNLQHLLIYLMPSLYPLVVSPRLFFHKLEQSTWISCHNDLRFYPQMVVFVSSQMFFQGFHGESLLLLLLFLSVSLKDLFFSLFLLILSDLIKLQWLSVSAVQWWHPALLSYHHRWTPRFYLSDTTAWMLHHSQTQNFLSSSPSPALLVISPLTVTIYHV